MSSSSLSSLSVSSSGVLFPTVYYIRFPHLGEFVIYRFQLFVKFRLNRPRQISAREALSRSHLALHIPENTTIRAYFLFHPKRRPANHHHPHNTRPRPRPAKKHYTVLSYRLHHPGTYFAQVPLYSRFPSSSFARRSYNISLGSFSLPSLSSTTFTKFYSKKREDFVTMQSKSLFAFFSALALSSASPLRRRCSNSTVPTPTNSTTTPPAATVPVLPTTGCKPNQAPKYSPVFYEALEY